jgi:hypothetical protein
MVKFPFLDPQSWVKKHIPNLEGGLDLGQQTAGLDSTEGRGRCNTWVFSLGWVV